MAEDEGVIGALDCHDLDALVMPTFASFHLPAIAGLPIVTVPLGFFPANTPVVMNANGMTVNIGPGIPFGISFIGRRWSEETLISFAYAFEQRTIARRKMRPFLHPTFDLGDRILNANEVRLSTQPPAAPPASTRPTFNTAVSRPVNDSSSIRAGPGLRGRWLPSLGGNALVSKKWTDRGLRWISCIIDIQREVGSQDHVS